MLAMKQNVMLAMSKFKVVWIKLCQDLDDEFKSYTECCQSLGVDVKINSFLNYIHLYGTYANPKGENGSNGI